MANKYDISDTFGYILQTYSRPHFVLERGEGVYLYDTAGQRYLDFVAGIAVNALGYGDQELTHTITQQATKLIHVSNLYHTLPSGELARVLVESSPAFARVFFCNSGTEAVEGAIKFARKVARERNERDKTTIVAFEGSFHGRTMGAVAVTSREKYREPFMPVMPGVRFAPFNDTAQLEQVITADVCAVIIEPVQGEGGLRVATQAFLQQIRQLCTKHRAVLITDEIQCGMGRTGTLWAHEPYHILPDIMTIAKPLGGGLPIGAILVNQDVAEAIHPGDHGTTFGGGPLVTAVAQVVFRRISNPAFLEHVHMISAYFDKSLHDLAQSYPDRILEVRGCGLMRGLRITGAVHEVREAGHKAGLLIATSGEDVIRLLPPLIVTQSHIDEAITILRQILSC